MSRRADEHFEADISARLRAADALWAPPETFGAGLAERVARRAAQRRLRRRLTAGAATTLAAAVGLSVLLRAPAPRGAPPPAPAVAAALLDEESRLAVALRTAALLRAAPARGQIAADPAQRAATECDQAAGALFSAAERLERELHLPDAAADNYRAITTSFSATRYAAAALSRLQELEHKKGAAS